MERAFSTPAVAADAAAVTEVVAAVESSLYGESTFSQADLEDPDALGRGIGRLIATGLEEHAARGGARRIQAGMTPALGWGAYEKELGAPISSRARRGPSP